MRGNAVTFKPDFGHTPYTLDKQAWEQCQSLMAAGYYEDTKTLFQGVWKAHTLSVGIGIRFEVRDKDSPLVVTQVKEQGSAGRDGTIKAGDVIHSVDSLPTAGMDVEAVTSKLLGPLGSKTTLLIENPSSGKQAVTLVRQPPTTAADEAMIQTRYCINHLVLLQQALKDRDEQYSMLLRKYEKLKGQSAPVVDSPQVGVGLVLGTQDKATEIIDVVPGMAAEVSNLASAARTGPYSRTKHQFYNIIEVGDTLIAVDGIMVAGQRLSAIKKLFLGPPGSKCILDLQKKAVSAAVMPDPLTQIYTPHFVEGTHKHGVRPAPGKFSVTLTRQAFSATWKRPAP